MAIKYRVYKNPVSKKENYTAKIISNDFYDKDKLIERMANSGTSLTKADIIAVFELASSTVERILKEGNSVSIGGMVNLKLKVKGNFNSLTDNFDSERHSITLQPEISKDFRKITEKQFQMVKETKEPPYPGFERFEDIKTNSVNSRISPDGIGVIYGKNLKFDTQKDDEGLYLINESTKNSIKVVSFQKITDKTIVFQIPHLENGIYTMEIITRVRKGKAIRRNKTSFKLSNEN